MPETVIDTESLRPVGPGVLLEGDPDAPAGRAVARAWQRYGMEVRGGEPAPDASPGGESAPDVYCVVAIGNEALGAPRDSAPLPRERVARVLEAMSARGFGRAVLVTDASPHIHDDADPDLAARRAADLAWWQHLAKRCAARGVLVNTVRVGYAPFLGHELDAAAEEELLRHLISRRPVRPAELASVLRLLASRGFENVAGETFPLDGGLDAGFVPMPRPAKPGKASGGRREPEPVEADGPDPFGLGGRVLLVTGASSGIGASIAREAAARGADVVLVARRRPELERLAEEVRALGRRAWALPADLSVPARVPELIKEAWDAAGGIDGLAYAAGVVSFDGPGDNSAHRERLLALNSLSYAAACDALVERWSGERRPGAVAAVSSLAAVSAPVANLASYGISKAAMARYTSHLATTAARHRVRANCVLPGFVRTPMTDVTNPAFLESTLRLVPTGRMSEPGEIAAMICYLLSPAADGLTGAQLRADGGGYSLLGLPALGGARAADGPPTDGPPAEDPYSHTPDRDEKGGRS
ncbi:SDR family NAD(P)-dependent oxidoreductase [Streptomyces sp. H27-D2]|uniref:SDR family NAD(P)-dependent oxidoreductase n=1 Tax=Streptomyces sp. H27-D2 TaxID=3046304 RepID=UPI002DBA3D25|nr:SDR family oxidoreductase [Streptomyces sp. H27-D2]MEC4019147.1 SDR family oxidoreductase [Streptomyces sp. H27-D2]